MRNDILHKFRKLLSLRGVTVAVIVLAILFRVIQLVYFFNIRVDRNYQLLATQNFVQGGGFSLKEPDASDLSAVVYTPLVKWPPGYSLLVAPFYFLTGHDYLVAAIIVDILFAVILIFISRAILRVLGIPIYLINLYTLVSSLFIYYFYFITSSDGIASCFFMLGLYFALRMAGSGTSSFKDLILMTIFLFACAFMKYLFMPVTLVIPLLLLAKGLSQKNRQQIRAGFACIAGIIIPIGAILFYQSAVSGSAAYVSDATRGFYPGNLLSAYPVFPGALIKPDTASMMFDEHTVNIIYSFLFIIALIAALLFLAIRVKNYRHDLHNDFFILTLVVSLATTAFLAFLSIRIAKAEDLPGNWWTFIQEPRYYGLPNLLIHLSAFLLVHRLLKRTGRTSLALLVTVTLLLSPEFLRGAIFTLKRITNISKEQYSWQNDLNVQKFAGRVIDANRAVNRALLVTGPSYYINNRISLYSDIAVIDEKDLAMSSLRSSRPLGILYAAPEGKVKDPSIIHPRIVFSFAGNKGGVDFWMGSVKTVK